MVVWLSHAFWYTLAGLFAASVVYALGRLVWSILVSCAVIVVSLPKASRYWLRRARR